MDDKASGWGRSNLLPIVLIAVGVIVLIGNLGILEWGSLLGLLSLWPIVLLAVGVDMLSRGRYRTYVVIGALLVAGLFYAAERGAGGAFGGSAARTHSIEHAVDGVREADVRIEGSVNSLHLDGFSGGDALVRGTIVTRRGEALIDRFDRRGNTAVVVLGTRRAGLFRSLGSSENAPWNLSLRRGLPMTLDVDTGVGGSTLDLRGLDIRSLDIDGGVGNMELLLPATGTFRASIDAGVGNVTVRVPEGLAASIEVDTGIGQVSVDPSFQKDGDDYRSSDYDRATNRVDLAIDGGLGAVTIERVP